MEIRTCTFLFRYQTDRYDETRSNTLHIILSRCFFLFFGKCDVKLSKTIVSYKRHRKLSVQQPMYWVLMGPARRRCSKTCVVRQLSFTFFKTVPTPNTSTHPSRYSRSSIDNFFFYRKNNKSIQTLFFALLRFGRTG